MSAEVEELKTRVAALESMLALAAREHGELRRDAEAAVSLLLRLRDYLKPEMAREAVSNAMRGTWLPNDDKIWSHVVPAYKVDEVTEAVLRCLGGGA